MGEMCKNTKKKPHVGKGKKGSFQDNWMLCNQRENPSTFIFGKEYIFLCFQGRTLLSAFPHTDPFSSTSMEGTCHHTSHLPSASSQANSIQLGAVRVGCSGSCSVPWPLLWHWPQPCPLELPPFTAHPAASSSQHSPAPGVQAHGLLAKATYRGWRGCKAPWCDTGTAALIFLQHCQCTKWISLLSHLKCHPQLSCAFQPSPSHKQLHARSASTGNLIHEKGEFYCTKK